VFIRAAFGQYEFRELHFPVYYMEKKWKIIYTTNIYKLPIIKLILENMLANRPVFCC
jgi:hypothetical protein